MGTGLRGSPVALTEMYDVALLDLDGVVYLGDEPVPGATDALSEARERGMRCAFVTNNASRSPKSIVDHLARLGIPAGERDIVTSAQAAARLLRDRVPDGAAVLVVGGAGLRDAIRSAEFRVVTRANEAPAAVVQGYSTRVDYGALTEASLAVAAGALWVGTNGDATIPSPRGPLPGNGALLSVVATATGEQPILAGKPERALHAASVDRTEARHPLVVGDRLDTDIEGAARAECPSLLTLTGVTSPADLLCAPVSRRPTYLARDLRGLLRPHPPVSIDAEGVVRCAGWTVRRGQPRQDPRRQQVAVVAAGSPAEPGTPVGSAEMSETMDALRALASMAWWSSDSGTHLASLEAADPRAERALESLNLTMRKSLC